MYECPKKLAVAIRLAVFGAMLAVFGENGLLNAKRAGERISETGSSRP